MSNSLINLKKYYSTRTALFLEFLLLFIFPNVLIELEPDLFRYRDYVLLLGICYVLLVNWMLKLSNKDYGLTRINFKQALLNLAPFTLMAALFLIFLYTFWPDILNIPEFSQSHQVQELGYSKNTIMILYLIISAPIQEFLFRAFYINRLSLVEKSEKFLILFSGFAFMLIHWQFNNTFFTFGALVLGLVYAKNFIKYKNIWAIIISHSIIGGIIGMLWLNF